MPKNICIILFTKSQSSCGIALRKKNYFKKQVDFLDFSTLLCYTKYINFTEELIIMSNITENYRIINTPTLVSTIKEGHKSGERFCFILGSGASVTSGIPSGKESIILIYTPCVFIRSIETDIISLKIFSRKLLRASAIMCLRSF